MKKNNLTQLALGVVLSTQMPVLAGESTPAPMPEPMTAANNGNWCTLLKSKPKLYKNKENPIIQEIGIEGRLQWQTAHIDVNGVDGLEDSDTFTEWRRARLGTKVKFLNYFSAKYQINIVDDGRPSGNELQWGYDSIDEAFLTFDLGKAIGCETFDELTVGYGRYKYALDYEAIESSKEILTVERSALSNKVYESARPTGLKLDAVKGDWEFGAALYSSSVQGDHDQEFSGWQDGEILLFTTKYKASDSLDLGFGGVYNNADLDDAGNDQLAYEWATSLNAHYHSSRFGIVGDLIVGDNGDQTNPDREGGFYGIMVMPYYWLVEDKLQAVAQFQHMASDEDEGVRINSRYGRRDHNADVNAGRGDSHNSIYAGLNYYLCGHNAKIMGGVEYQEMDTPDGDFDSLTYVLAVRTFF